jgi:tripartite-type tricarboxylate transporter receptor subunit TctC
MPGFEIGSWYGILAPAKTTVAVVRRLNAEIVKAMQDPELKSKYAQQGLDTIAGTPEEAAAYLKSESVRWTRVVKNAGDTIQ